MDSILILIEMYLDGMCISEDLIPLHKAMNIATKCNGDLFNPVLDFKYFRENKEVYPVFDGYSCVGFE